MRELSVEDQNEVAGGAAPSVWWIAAANAIYDGLKGFEDGVVKGWNAAGDTGSK